MRSAAFFPEHSAAFTLGRRSSHRRVRLTPAERETALLAAARRSNRDIAAELWLSVRTVESYLSNAYEKLGVPGRTHLAAAFES